MIYSLTAISLFLLSIYLCRADSYEKTRLALLATILWLILHDGLRWEIGTDWDPYHDFFMGTENTHFEPGYVLLNEIIGGIWRNYTFFLLCFAVITYGILCRFLKQYAVQPVMALCLYYCEMMGSMGSNRSILAMFCCVLSLQFIMNRNLKAFILMMIVAMCFHLAAITFFPAYFLYQKQYRNQWILMALLLAFVVNRSGLINRIPLVEYAAMVDAATTTSSDFAGYIADEAFSVSLIGSFKRFVFVFLALQVRKVINDEQYDFFVLLYSVGAFIFILFNGSILQLMAGRGSSFYNIYAIIVIPSIVLNLPYGRHLKLALWSLIFLLDFFVMWRDMNGYINTVGYDIYNPYKCVLF